jgi:TolB-like protein
MSPTNEQVEQSLERVLQSAFFKNADRQSRFLRHVVEKHLRGDDSALREIAIGFEVYDRRETYDPKEDPIVRVEASRLRSRLREYYETAVAEETIRIDIPKGSYVPTFAWRQAVLGAETPAVATPIAEVVRVPVASLAPVLVPTPKAGRSIWIGLAGVVAIGLVVWLVVALRPRPAARLVKVDSIAVLPFSDLSEKHDLTHLSEALTEQIQDELTRNRELRVVGNTSAKQAAASSDLREAARRVGVAALIQGSVRQEEDKLRVTVRLLDGRTGSAVWSESFDGDRKKLFDMEEKIARAVADKLALQTGTRPEGTGTSTDPRRVQAYEYYQQARALASRDSAGPLDEIFRLYQLSATTDPTYAPAHAGLAGVLIESQADLGGGADIKKRALEETRKAIALDPGLPLGYATLILYYRDVELDWAQARSTCADSLQRFPNSAQILVACASIEGILLNRAKQLQLMRRAVELDPLSPRMHGGLMFALYQIGQFDEALNEANFAIKNGPSNAFVFRHQALILAAKGDPAGGLKVIDEAKARLGGVPAEWSPVRGYLLGLLHRRAEAEQLVREFSAQGALPHQLGFIYLGMDEKEKALAAYERSMATDRADVAHSIPEYYMRVLDGLPKFEAMKQKLGIPQE